MGCGASTESGSAPVPLEKKPETIADSAETVAAAEAAKATGKVDLGEIFKQFDTSGDGSLDATELMLALRVAVGADISLDDSRRLVESVDDDGSGNISFAEFEAICRDKSN